MQDNKVKLGLCPDIASNRSYKTYRRLCTLENKIDCKVAEIKRLLRQNQPKTLYLEITLEEQTLRLHLLHNESLSRYFQRITINENFVWTRVAELCEGLEVKLKESSPVLLTLVTNENMVQVLPPLSDFLSVNYVSKQDVLLFFWRYIKDNELQDTSAPETIVCNDQLHSLLQCDSFGLHETEKLLQPFLVPAPSNPISFTFPCTSKEKVYAIQVPPDGSIQDQDLSQEDQDQDQENDQEYQDQKAIDEIFNKLSNHHLKKEQLLRFMHTPGDFLKTLDREHKGHKKFVKKLQSTRITVPMVHNYLENIKPAFQY